MEKRIETLLIVLLLVAIFAGAIYYNEPTGQALKKGCKVVGGKIVCQDDGSRACSYKRACLDYNTYYIQNNDCSKRYTDCRSNEVCANGYCRLNTTTCTDSDGGIAPFTLGTVTWYNPTSTGYNQKSDYCSSGPWLTEWYCAVNGSVQFQGINCNRDYGMDCLNGACVRNATQNGTVQFLSSPSGAYVYKVSGPNGYISGFTPFTRSLVAGSYTVASLGVEPFYRQSVAVTKSFTVNMFGTTAVTVVNFEFNQTAHATCVWNSTFNNYTCGRSSGPGPTTCGGVPLGSSCTP